MLGFEGMTAALSNARLPREQRLAVRTERAAKARVRSVQRLVLRVEARRAAERARRGNDGPRV